MGYLFFNHTDFLEFVPDNIQFPIKVQNNIPVTHLVYIINLNIEMSIKYIKHVKDLSNNNEIDNNMTNKAAEFIQEKARKWLNE